MSNTERANFQRRAFLKALGFGTVGLTLVFLWRGISSLLKRRTPIEPLPIVWESFDFEAVTVDKTGTVKERKSGSAELFAEDFGNWVKLAMVKIPAGTFLMGAPESEEGRSPHDDLPHEVTVSEFAIGRFPVTQAVYKAVIGKSLSYKDNKLSMGDGNPSRFQGDWHPVENVSWQDAQKFCKKLSQQTGREYRLPTEAEWEYACRAGTTTPFHFGETITPDLANYGIGETYADGPEGGPLEKSFSGTSKIGIFPSNAFGLNDMHGNVWEWCSETWSGDCSRGVDCGAMRGGSWFAAPNLCRAAYRGPGEPIDSHSHSVGFRVVCAIS